MKKKILILVIGIIGILAAFSLLFIHFYFEKSKEKEINRYTNIPEKAEDFYAYTREIWLGSYVELCELDEKYWQQPEFYGEAWTRAKEKFYENPDYKFWGVYGYGAIPYKVGYTFTNLKKGDVFETCNFFHSGFGVWTYQGVKLEPFGENEYFDIEIEPNQFYLAPTFPVFEKGWTKKIKLKIIVKETPPPGKYVVGYTLVPTDLEFSRKTLKEILSLKVDKEVYLADCLKNLKDYDRCKYLINFREKKYVDASEYIADVPPLTVEVIVK